MSYIGRVDRSAVWGQISGTLSNQTDLQTSLDAKVDPNQLGSYRNKIINGGFDLWQRATSQTATGYGSADRWESLIVGTTQSVSRQSFGIGQTDVPDNPSFFYRNVVTSVAGAGNFALVRQSIENVRTAQGQNISLSFWAKADSNKNIAIELAQVFGTGGSPSSSVVGIGAQKIALTSSWQNFQVTIAVPSISGATFGTDNNHRLVLHFWFDAGSSFNSRTDTLGQQSGTFDLSQIQLEIGDEATPFELRHISQETELCQRYYEIGRLHMAGVATAASQDFAISRAYTVLKRASPTLVFSNNVTIGSIGTTTTASGQTNDSTLIAGRASTASGTFTWSSGFTADAEL